MERSEENGDSFQGQANMPSGHQKCKIVFLQAPGSNFPMTFLGFNGFQKPETFLPQSEQDV